jgi:hypothetical protein
LILLLTEGQVSDYRGAATMLPSLPDADMLIADKGYDSDCFREAPWQVSASNPAFPAGPAEMNRSNTMSRLTNGAIASSACSAGLRTDDGLRPDTTVAPTPS